ncbi:MAG: hypothetical protein HY647_06930 [Acidobacteria bacterium]|nr:hypothetical protein [Acidobacteriota bacterium]
MVGLDFLFGCAHNKTSLPITLRKKPGATARPPDQPRETYIVCLECGREFPYSWEQMKVVSAPRKRREKSAEPHGLVAWFSRHRWSSRGM